MTVRLKQGATALLLALALTLTGCWSRVEVNDLAIVAMMAIDRTEEGELQLWLQIVIPGAAGYGGQAGTRTGTAFITLTATGKTVLEASKVIQTKLSRQIFWGHTQVILIGERLARSGVRPIFDFLSRHRELRLTNYVLVARGDITELLATPVELERLPVEQIREISRTRVGTSITVRDWTQDLAQIGADPIMGVVELLPPPPGAPQGQSPTLQVSGTALFKRDKLVTFMDERITRGLLWLRNEVRRGVVTMEIEGVEGPVSLEWVNSRVTRTARLEGSKPVMYVLATTEGDITETQAPLDLADPDVVKKVEEAMNRSIKERMETALGVLREENVDAAAFGEVIRRQLPGVWQRLKGKWREAGLQRLKVVIEVDSKVRRTGLSSRPKGVRQWELEE